MVTCPTAGVVDRPCHSNAASSARWLRRITRECIPTIRFIFMTRFLDVFVWEARLGRGYVYRRRNRGRVTWQPGCASRGINEVTGRLWGAAAAEAQDEGGVFAWSPGRQTGRHRRWRHACTAASGGCGPGEQTGEVPEVDGGAVPVLADFRLIKYALSALDPSKWAFLQRSEMKGTFVHRRLLARRSAAQSRRDAAGLGSRADSWMVAGRFTKRVARRRPTHPCRLGSGIWKRESGA